jgi:hypothetical protein
MLVNELRMVEELQRETAAVKLKLATKVDNSDFQDALRHFVLREELYQRGAAAPASRPETRAAARPAGAAARRPPPATRPVPLVPGRTPFMLGVNDKFLKGKDNRLYLRETAAVGDPAFREHAVTGQPKSYYERSRTTMELDGVEAVFDFQPFVPVTGPHPSPKPRETPPAGNE